MRVPGARFRLLPAAALAVASSPALADCTKSRPETVVADLYLRSGSLTQAASRARLAPPLRGLVEAEVRKADPIDLWRWSGVRPTVGERLLVSDTLIEGRRATSRVSFTAADRPVGATERLFVEVQLVREADGCWRVDDIVRDGASLRERLAGPTPPESPASR